MNKTHRFISLCFYHPLPSSNNEFSPIETLNPSTTTGSHDSPNQPDRQQQLQPSNPQSTDQVAAAASEYNNNGNNPGKKRKPKETEWHSGSCSHDSDYKYAHSEEELRLQLDDTWDSTSERAKKAMKLEKNDDKCEEKEEDEIMMIEMLVGEGGEGSYLDPELSKCLVHLPRKWNSDNLSNFLNQ